MIKIDYPNNRFRFKEEGGKEFIFDEVRKQWIKLTPEEWVRQNFLQYLIQIKKYPASLIAVEKEIALGELKRRCDIIIYKNEKPWMIVECKEMNVELNDKVVEQILNYNQSLDVCYLIVSNGTTVFGFDTTQKLSLHAIPDY